MQQHSLTVASSALLLVVARRFQKVRVLHPALPTPNSRIWIPGQIGNVNAICVKGNYESKDLQSYKRSSCSPRQAKAHWCICQDWHGLSLLRMSQMRPRGLTKFWPVVSKIEMDHIQDHFAGRPWILFNRIAHYSWCSVLFQHDPVNSSSVRIVGSSWNHHQHLIMHSGGDPDACSLDVSWQLEPGFELDGLVRRAIMQQ